MPVAERTIHTEIKISDDHEQLLDWLHQTESGIPETTMAETSQEDYKFYAGDQDTDEIKAELEDQKRPVSVFNEIKPKVDMLIGLAAQTRFEPSIVPVGVEDEALAELVGGAYKHYVNKTKLVDREMDCFDHTVKSGRSLLYFYIDKQNPFKPAIKCKRIPGTNYKLDPDSIEYDLSDANYLFIDKWVTEDELKLFFPAIDPEIIKDSGDSTERPSFWNEAKEKFRLVEAWYRKWVKVKWFINPITKQAEYLTPERFTEFIKYLEEELEEEVESPEVIDTFMQKVFYMIFCDRYKLESGESQYWMEGLPAVQFAGYKNEDKNAWFGAITMMKDPQRAINTMRRQLSHLLQTLPKGILVHEIGAILNIEEYEERSADPTFHLEVGKGRINDYKFETQPGISPLYQGFDAGMVQSMKDSSGVQDELMGIQKTSREPGITVRTRQQAAVAVLYILFENFRKSRLESGRKLLRLMQQYVTAPEVIRIQGEKGMQLLQINTQMNPQSKGFNDISAGEYDLGIDEAVENATMRMTVAQILTDFAQNNPNTIPPHIVLGYADLPFSVKQEVKAFWEQQRELEQENIDADRAVKLAEIGAKSQTEDKKIEAQKEQGGNENDNRSKVGKPRRK